MHRQGFRAGRRALTTVSFLALAACGGSGDGSSESINAISPSPGGSGTLGAFYMSQITDEWRAAAAAIRDNAARYRLQNGFFTLAGGQVFANPLFSSRVDYARAVGLTGQGKVIAVVDSGFLRSHEVFAGKSNSVTGSPGADDHGTMVASIAAGNSDTMVGVAPGANVAFGSYDTYETLTAAAQNALARGAVAQNNSWGFSNTPVGATGFGNIFGNPAGQAWLDALSAYAAQGVVVFAVSNDNTATTAGLMEALPFVEPSLEPGWLAVGNAIPTFDDQGVSAGQMVSAGCLEAGPWCLVADGYWIAATAASNASYAEGTGSSFAAPQVAGALALLAEAFPALTPHQLRVRLLASADNTFAGFTAAGSVDLIEGTGEFLHDYSSEFGHGFLDIRAALLPIGTTVMATADGGTAATKDMRFASGAAFGDAVTRSLEGIDIAVSDALGAQFAMPGKAFAAETAPQSLADRITSRALSQDFRAARTARVSTLADTFAAYPGRTLDLRGPDGLTTASVLLGASDGGFGLAVSRALTDGDIRVDVGLKVARDGGTVMGFSGAGGDSGSDMAAVTLGISHDAGNAFFALSGEVGLADLAAPSALSGVSAARFDSVSLDIGSRHVFARDDRLALGVSMPVAVTSGAAEMVVPVALAEGRSEMRAVGIDLAPEERQVDISLSYQVPMGENSEMLFEIVHAENYGNRAGMTDTAAVIGMSWEF